jgi:hypothetical protein
MDVKRGGALEAAFNRLSIGLTPPALKQSVALTVDC